MGATRREMVGWTDIGSDVNWSDYGGIWIKKDAYGGWYVIQFDNRYYSLGEQECKETDTPKFFCSVKYIDLPEIAERIKIHALDYYGPFTKYVIRFDVDNSWRYQGQCVSPECPEALLVDALVHHSVSGPLETFQSPTGPWKLRNCARKYAERLMKDSDARDARLDQRVNMLGNTCRDFARGHFG